MFIEISSASLLLQPYKVLLFHINVSCGHFFLSLFSSYTLRGLACTPEFIFSDFHSIYHTWLSYISLFFDFNQTCTSISPVYTLQIRQFLGLAKEIVTWDFVKKLRHYNIIVCYVSQHTEHYL